MKKYDLKDSCISFTSARYATRDCVDRNMMEDMLECMADELQAIRANSKDHMTYRDILFFKEAFRKGFAAAHMINHRMMYYEEA